MANEEQVQHLKRSVDEWNEWRLKHPGEKVDLSRADLNYANLSNANLEGADLQFAYLIHADLSRADLNRADLSTAQLSRAILHRAVLNGANLINAKLRGANLVNAELHRADLRGANLVDADLRGSMFGEANLSGANLNGANLTMANLNRANLSATHVGGTVFARMYLPKGKGLNEIHHDGPSIIELQTVQLPEDGSTLHFLRGAGVPDEWIDFYRASTMSPIQYHSCFISYARQDKMLAYRLHADLQNHSVRCWFAPEDLKIGDKIRPRIDEAIHLHEKLLLHLPEHALASTWVEDEVEAALEKEHRQQREVLFPVSLDESVTQTSQAWAAKLRRTRHIGDFTHWTDPQAYQQAFERLLRDLKAES